LVHRCFSFFERQSLCSSYFRPDWHPPRFETACCIFEELEGGFDDDGGGDTFGSQPLGQDLVEDPGLTPDKGLSDFQAV
jgi:hypothetical protein